MSKWVMIIGCLALAFSSLIYYPKWKMNRTEATISWDVSGYYLYLPAFFIYRDLKKLEFKPGLDEKYYPSSSPYQSFTHYSGNQVMKYTSGLAILYTPFFLLAHGIAKIFGLVADGYSPIYQFFISFGSLIYAFLGLIGLRRLLLKYFTDSVVAFSLLILIFTSNYFDYASITGAMSHNYLFTLYVILMMAIDRFYASKNWKWFNVICFIIGLMVLIRPTELISGILVLGWGINSISGLRERLMEYIKQFRKIILGGVFFIVCPLIQIVYWKYVSGEWIVYSYQDQGFSWLEGHHILQGLFSYRAGWLVYSPLMILSLIGIVLMWYYKSTWTWMTTAFTLMSLYFTFAWDEWTYGGSLGQRALVQHYPVFVFGIATCFKHSIENKFWKTAWIILIAFGTYYNLWLTHQAHRGGIYEAGMMNKAYFWATLFKSKNELEHKKILDTNEPVIPFDEFKAKVILDSAYVGDSVHCINNSTAKNLFQGLLPVGKLKVKVRIRVTQKEWDMWQMAQLIVQYQRGDQNLKTVLIRLHRFINDGENKWIDLTTKSPEDSFDQVRISVWNPSQKEICIEGVKIYAAE